jgi:uncharacterized membrane protein YidH (DUF202 family)
MKIFGVILILAGIVALAYGSFSFTTHRKAVAMGPLQLERKTRHTLPLPPMLGVGGILVGTLLLGISSRER